MKLTRKTLRKIILKEIKNLYEWSESGQEDLVSEENIEEEKKRKKRNRKKKKISAKKKPKYWYLGGYGIDHDHDFADFGGDFGGGGEWKLKEKIYKN